MNLPSYLYWRDYLVDLGDAQREMREEIYRRHLKGREDVVHHDDVWKDSKVVVALCFVHRLHVFGGGLGVVVAAWQMAGEGGELEVDLETLSLEFGSRIAVPLHCWQVG